MSLYLVLIPCRPPLPLLELLHPFFDLSLYLMVGRGGVGWGRVGCGVKSGGAGRVDRHGKGGAVATAAHSTIPHFVG